MHFQTLVSVLTPIFLSLFLLAGCQQQESQADSAAIEQVSAPGYVCPMHPEVTSKEPGRCPLCGMDLVVTRATADAPAGSAPADASVKLSPALEQSLGIRTARVERGSLPRVINTVGRIATVNLIPGTPITAGIAGRVEKAPRKGEAAIIRKNELLYEIYSPERFKAQEDYLAIWRAQDQEKISEQWKILKRLGLSGPEISALEKSGKPVRSLAIRAPRDGTVISSDVVVGNLVVPESRLMLLGGLNVVGVTAEIFERQWTWIEYGQRASMRLPSLPGVTFHGTVELVNDVVSFSTRTLTTRLRFETLDTRLRTSMIADLTIYAKPQAGVLHVPRDALIRTGDSARVVVAHGDGRFEPVAVVAGIESGDQVEIQSGLKADQRVVVSGQFLIDSESSLGASFRRMHNAASADAHTHDAHGNH